MFLYACLLEQNFKPIKVQRIMGRRADNDWPLFENYSFGLRVNIYNTVAAYSTRCKAAINDEHHVWPTIDLIRSTTIVCGKEHGVEKSFI